MLCAAVAMVESTVTMSFSTAIVMYCRSLLLLALLEACCSFELKRSTTEHSVLYQSDFIPSELPSEELCYEDLPSLLCSVRCYEMSQKPYCNKTTHRCKCGSSVDLDHNTPGHHISSLPMFARNHWTSLDRSHQNIQDTRSNTKSPKEHLSYNDSAGTNVGRSPEETHHFTIYSLIDISKIFGFNDKNVSSSEDVDDVDTKSLPENSTEAAFFSGEKLKHDWSTEAYTIVLAVILIFLLVLLLVSYYCKKRKDQRNAESIFKTVNVSSNK